MLSLHWRSFRKIEVLDLDSSKRSVSSHVNCEKCLETQGRELCCGVRAISFLLCEKKCSGVRPQFASQVP